MPLPWLTCFILNEELLQALLQQQILFTMRELRRMDVCFYFFSDRTATVTKNT